MTGDGTPPMRWRQRWQGLLAGDASMPYDDSLQQKGAGILASLLWLLAAYHLLAGLQRALGPESVLEQPMILNHGLNLLLALLSLGVLRLRDARVAAVVFVTGSLLMLSAVFADWGLAMASRTQLLNLLPVLVAGILLGRRPLWLAAAWLCGLLLLGALRDLSSGYYQGGQPWAMGHLLFAQLIGVLLLAVGLDKTLSMLGHSLRASLQRGEAFARKRDQLQLQIQESERSREQLVHALKMENVGRLASGIAHDFNHLLAVILGYAAKGRRSDDPAELRTALQGVESAARRATAVSRRLLDFSRQEQARPQLLDAAATIDAMEPVLRQLFDDGVALDIRTAGVDCQILFDPAQLEMILISMAANANQAMPEGGRFELWLAWQPSRDELQIGLRDTGHGMSEEVRRRCMDPFFTTKPQGHGTGLGLAVSINLVRAAGGRIDVESAPEQGTTFLIHLPAQRIPRLAEADPPAQSWPSRR